MSNIAYIRTSDRSAFRRCRRRWGWSSHLKGNLEVAEGAEPLWLGSGFHYALEDFHGPKNWPSAAAAFEGYTDACRRTPNVILPATWLEAKQLATDMLNFYADIWLRNRPYLKTYVHNGHHQCEVNFEIPLPIEVDGYDQVIYRGSLDRVIIDEHKRLWVVEYKTAKQFQTGHFDVDGQVSAYCWAASVLYPNEIAGVIYQQHKKTLPQPPEFLKTAKRYSTNKQQSTNQGLYRQALSNLYGVHLEGAPPENIEFLNWLSEQESEDQDPFIRRDWIYRSDHQIAAEGEKILMEVPEMLNPDLPLYPNPTRDCSWDCRFMSPCIVMDDGGDWEADIEGITVQREEDLKTWRQHLKPPSQRPQPKPQNRQSPVRLPNQRVPVPRRPL